MWVFLNVSMQTHSATRAAALLYSFIYAFIHIWYLPEVKYYVVLIKLSPSLTHVTGDLGIDCEREALTNVVYSV